MLNLLSNGSTFYMSCNRKDVSVPAPDENGSHVAVQLFRAYLEDAASQTMSYDQFLRPYNTNARPPRKYERLRSGTVALACETTSPWRALANVESHLKGCRGVTGRQKPRSATSCVVCDVLCEGSFAREVALQGCFVTLRVRTLLSAIRCLHSYLHEEVIYAEPQIIEEHRGELNAGNKVPWSASAVRTGPCEIQRRTPRSAFGEKR